MTLAVAVHHDMERVKARLLPYKVPLRTTTTTTLTPSTGTNTLDSYKAYRTRLAQTGATLKPPTSVFLLGKPSIIDPIVLVPLGIALCMYACNAYSMIAMGILYAWMGGIGHDATHHGTKFFTRYYLDATGLSSTAWRRTHCINHHLHTNDPGIDQDHAEHGALPFMSFTHNPNAYHDPVLVMVKWVYLTLAITLVSPFIPLPSIRQDATPTLYAILKFAALYACTGSDLGTTILYFWLFRGVSFLYFMNISFMTHNQHHASIPDDWMANQVQNTDDIYNPWTHWEYGGPYGSYFLTNNSHTTYTPTRPLPPF